MAQMTTRLKNTDVKMRNRILSQKNTYFLPREEYLTALHFALRYPLWCEELRTDPDTSRAIRYDGDRVQTSGGSDMTAETAMRRKIIADKKKLVEETAMAAGKEIYPFLLKGVTGGFTFWQLKQQGLPCEKDMYYDRRHKFYYLLAQKI